MAVIQAIEQKTGYRTSFSFLYSDERKEIRQVRKVKSLDFRNGEIKWHII